LFWSILFCRLKDYPIPIRGSKPGRLKAENYGAIAFFDVSREFSVTRRNSRHHGISRPRKEGAALRSASPPSGVQSVADWALSEAGCEKNSAVCPFPRSPFVIVAKKTT
jgi:hypothetical protein